jgi:hypothetical protein
LDEDKLNHEDVVVSTNVHVHHPAAELSKVLQSVEQLTTSIGKQSEEAKLVKVRELPWRITPSQEVDRRFKHYLMLSKIRLTCKTPKYLLLKMR